MKDEISAQTRWLLSVAVTQGFDFAEASQHDLVDGFEGLCRIGCLELVDGRYIATDLALEFLGYSVPETLDPLEAIHDVCDQTLDVGFEVVVSAATEETIARVRVDASPCAELTMALLLAGELLVRTPLKLQSGITTQDAITILYIRRAAPRRH